MLTTYRQLSPKQRKNVDLVFFISLAILLPLSGYTVFEALAISLGTAMAQLGLEVHRERRATAQQ
ncbi:MAG: hypothetical protein LWW86_16120 [Micrococcales bacterium]|nr:hypothetical protein [Micrococcales bacterium]